MSEQTLQDELRALSERATPGEWRCDKYDTRQFIFQVQKDLDRDDRIAYVYGAFADKEQEAIPNAAFIVACVNYVRFLLAKQAAPASQPGVRADQLRQSSEQAFMNIPDPHTSSAHFNEMARLLNAALASAVPQPAAAPAEPPSVSDIVSSEAEVWPEHIEALRRRDRELIERGVKAGIAKLGDEVNQCLQIIVTNAGLIKDSTVASSANRKRAIAIEDAVGRAAKSIRALDSAAIAEKVPNEGKEASK